MFTADVCPGVLGWLGLNAAVEGGAAGEVAGSPAVGVRHQDLARLVAEFRGERLHPHRPPTVSVQIGYL